LDFFCRCEIFFIGTKKINFVGTKKKLIIIIITFFYWYTNSNKLSDDFFIFLPLSLWHFFLCLLSKLTPPPPYPLDLNLTHQDLIVSNGGAMRAFLLCTTLFYSFGATIWVSLVPMVLRRVFWSLSPTSYWHPPCLSLILFVVHKVSFDWGWSTCRKVDGCWWIESLLRRGCWQYCHQCWFGGHWRFVSF